MIHKRLWILYSCIVVISFGCASIPEDALRLTQTSLQERQLKSRKFETTNETSILTACAGLMQDMGFNLDESETKLGIIVGSKQRSAVDPLQVAAAVTLAVLTGAFVPTDQTQKMRCSIATYPHNNSHIVVRVTFQRIVWNTQGQVTTREGIKEPEIYQEFFDRLSKAIFLEAQSL